MDKGAGHRVRRPESSHGVHMVEGENYHKLPCGLLVCTMACAHTHAHKINVTVKKALGNTNLKWRPDIHLLLSLLVSLQRDNTFEQGQS